MSTFDDPFDADRKLSRSGCVCGQHGSSAEHEHAALTLRCEPAQSDEQRYEGVVASAVHARDLSAGRRAPGVPEIGRSLDGTRRAVSQFFPIKTATEALRASRRAGKEGSQGRLHPDHLRDADHHGAPLGFYAKYGLNVEVVKTAGWAVIRDKTINREYDAAHMLAPMPIAISLGLGVERRSRSPCRRSRTSTGRASRLR